MKVHSSVASEWGKSGKRMTSGRERPCDRAGGRKRFRQFMICGGIFVVLVAVKLLLPGKLEPISRVLQQNMDVQAVFSAVGSMVSRQEPPQEALREVYQEVFAFEEEMPAGAPVRLPENGTAFKLLRTYWTDDKGAYSEPEVSNLAYLLYSDENLPENVSLAQEILGFEYCTPVSGTVSSSFGYREHPTEGEERFHYGVDLAADSGTAITCFADGTVTVVGESSSYGKYCIVAHENGYETLYAHCSKITAASGAQVLRGEKIAEVGATGMTTGAHLHFELLRDGMYLNPIYYVVSD